MRCKHTLRNKFASDGIVMRQTWLWEYYTRSFTIVYVVLRCFTLCLTVFKCFVYTCVVRVFTCWARGKFPWDFCSESQQDPTRVFHNHNKLPHDFSRITTGCYRSLFRFTKVLSHHKLARKALLGHKGVAKITCSVLWLSSTKFVDYHDNLQNNIILDQINLLQAARIHQHSQKLPEAASIQTILKNAGKHSKHNSKETSH